MSLTPPPIDTPDWYDTASKTCELFYDGVLVGNLGDHFGPFYVGDCLTFGFQCNVVGGPWGITLEWGMPDAPFPGLVQAPSYEGITDCLVHDNVPVTAPYVSVSVFYSGHDPGHSFQLFHWTSKTPEVGATIIFEEGLCINQNHAVCPAGEVTTFPSALLLPGLHQWCFDVDANLTGVANLSGKRGTVLIGRMVRIFNPPMAQGFQDQVIVSNLQPVWEVNNEGLADVPVNATLTRGF